MITGPVLRRGATGDDVRKLQTYLVAAKLFDQADVIGIFGPKTEAAVIRFQSQWGIQPTGVMDANTWPKFDGRTGAVPGLDADTAHAITMLHGAHNATGRSPIQIDDGGIMHGDGVTYVPTMRIQKLATPDGHVEGMLWHWTDTRNAGAINLANRIAKLGAFASCHAWIDRPGVIAQSGRTDVGTWHGGSDTAAVFSRSAQGHWTIVPPQLKGKVRAWGANSWMWGTEIENVGEVRELNGQWLGWPFRWDYRNPSGDLEAPAVVPRDEVHIVTDGHGLHLYTDAQVESAIRITGTLVQRYGLTREACAWGHREVDPKRRTDPGDLWMVKDQAGKLVAGHLKTVLDTVFGPEQ